MHSTPTKQGRRARWEDGGCVVEPLQEMDIWTCCRAVIPELPREGSRARSQPGAQPSGCHIPVAHRPDPLGSPRQMASPTHPAPAYPTPAPGAHQLSFAWRSYLLALSELAGPPLSPSPLPRHLAAQWHFRGSLSLFPLSTVEGHRPCKPSSHTDLRLILSLPFRS